MRVPLSWLREYVDLPAAETGRGLATRLVRAGLEVETVEPVGADLSGPLVVGRVLDVEEFTASNGKTIRFCHVNTGQGDTGGEEPRGIVCGATNFAAGDLVVVACPGAVLPGGFAISTRKTYGHLSDGMICSTRELGVGDDHAGILVLPPEAGKAGDDAMPVLGLPDEVLDIAVTPDRGYCLSMRGVARETATAYGLPLRDPAEVDLPLDDGGVGAGDGGGGDGGRGGAVRRVEIAVQQAGIEDPTACDVIVLRTVEGLDPAAPTPPWMRRRLHLAGMRPISLPVDVTNYVMLELGQPLHAFDRARLTGTVTVRRARSGERLETLDHVQRDLDPGDVLIADDSGALSLAGTMGGRNSEIGAGSRELVIEAAHFDAVATASMSRRHKVSSEASRRFERGVDPELPRRASARAVALLAELGGARLVGSSVADARPGGASSAPAIEIDADLASRVVGLSYPEGEPERLLREIGCTIEETSSPGATSSLGTANGRRLRVTPPSWRPDLTDPFDLVEEVARLHGYDTIPSVLPVAPAGRGLTEGQRLHRQVGRALAAAGYVEAPSYPFVGPATWDALGLPADDVRRRTERLANPLSAEEPELRTTLLPGLLRALARNVGRGHGDVALFETGLVVLPRADAPARAPRLGVDRRPDPEQIAALDAALPDQPRHLAVVLTGDREPVGWWGPSRSGCWADAVEAARTAARAVGARLTVRRGDRAPWHPRRCAELALSGDGDRPGDPAGSGRGVHNDAAGAVVGHAGELHPRAVVALGLPPRTAAMELDLDALMAAGGGIVEAPRVSTYPVATQDVALVVADGVSAADVESALRDGAGDLLEGLRLFDVYTGSSVGEDRRSLAYALRFRAADRTLTTEEASAARDAAVAEAARRTGAVLRGTR